MRHDTAISVALSIIFTCQSGPFCYTVGVMGKKEHTWPGRERRAHPRVRADLAAQIVTHEKLNKHVVVRSKNISCSGLYFHLDEYIAPFQKLHLSIIVPLVERGRVHNEVIQLDAVTVRTQPEEEEGW